MKDQLNVPGHTVDSDSGWRGGGVLDVSALRRLTWVAWLTESHSFYVARSAELRPSHSQVADVFVTPWVFSVAFPLPTSLEPLERF